MTNPELDIKVATEVCGFELEKRPTKIDGISINCWRPGTSGRPSWFKLSVEKWHPSTDIRQAMEEVVPKLESDQWWLTLRRCGNGWHKFAWQASFDSPWKTEKPFSYHEVDNTPARAICLAAVAAVEAKA